ncbi:MAG: TIR domain-containing protein [Candidatus Omnitrophica bacterium]|nr:TIR domain-containing protein [Candidatus Omnitrophota bacterium]
MNRSVKLFLSYARGDDEPFVKRLYGDLTSAGFEVWYDRVSMPSRQLTFHTEIREAVNSADRLLLVVGPKAVESDYVEQEWRWALLQDKCLNPILRLNGRAADKSVIDGYKLIPEELVILHSEDFRDDTKYDAALANLKRQLSEPIPPFGKLVAVPELPAHFKAQPERLKKLRELLLIDLNNPTVVTGAAARVGLEGMGGIGKSVLASALARNPEIRRVFSDGIFWIGFGQKPDIVSLQRRIVTELCGDALFNEIEIGKQRMTDLLKSRAALIIIDDVWDRKHADAFNVLGPRCKLLLTSRDSGLVTSFAGNGYQVQLLTEAESLELLATTSGFTSQTLPKIASDIVKECQRLPLALALCGGMARKGHAWENIHKALKNARLEVIADRHEAEEQHTSLWRTMEVSVQVLSKEEKERFVELAVFREDIEIPLEALITLWTRTGDMDEFSAAETIISFKERSLIQVNTRKLPDGTTQKIATIHDLIRDYAVRLAKQKEGGIAALHAQMLDAYKTKCPKAEWHTGPNDGYYFENLRHHFIVAGEIDKCVDLFTGLRWIEAKCKYGLTFDLENDFRDLLRALPEAAAQIEEERKREMPIARWADEMVAYSKEWSLRGVKGSTGQNPEPKLPEPVPACGLSTDEEMNAEIGRLIASPTRVDRVKAFSNFVATQLYPLSKYASHPGFVIQQASNSAPDGPVHRTASDLLTGICIPFILRVWKKHDRYEPKQALLMALEGHNDIIRSVSVTPDHRRAVSGGSDKTLRVWDLESGVCLHSLHGHDDIIRSAAITPDGVRAVTGSWDKTLRVWDIENGVCSYVLRGHTDDVRCVAITPCGKKAVSGSRDGTLRVWDLENGSCISALKKIDGHIESVAITPCGRKAVSGSSDKKLRVWDLETGACSSTFTGHNNNIVSVAVTPDCKVAVSGDWNGEIRVWDIEKGICSRSLKGHSDIARSVAITADGKRAVSGSRDKTLRLWDLSNGGLLRVISGDSDDMRSISIVPDGRMAVTAGSDKKLRLWDIASVSFRKAPDTHRDDVRGVSITPDGRTAVSGSKDKTIRVWDIESGTCLRTLTGHSDIVRCVAVAPDGKTAFSGGGDRVLRVWDIEKGVFLRALPGHTGSVKCISFSPCGKKAISACGDSTIRIWDIENWVCLRVLEGHSDDVRSVSITTSGKHAVSGSKDKTIRVWDIESGACLRVIEAHTDIVRSVAITPDGRRAVSGSSDKTLRVWDIESGSCIRVIEGHSDYVMNVAVTSDGRKAVSIGWDETVRLWDIETGRCLSIFSFPEPATALALKPDDSGAIVGTHNGQLLFLDYK